MSDFRYVPPRDNRLKDGMNLVQAFAKCTRKWSEHLLLTEESVEMLLILLGEFINTTSRELPHLWVGVVTSCIFLV